MVYAVTRTEHFVEQAFTEEVAVLARACTFERCKFIDPSPGRQYAGIQARLPLLPGEGERWTGELPLELYTRVLDCEFANQRKAAIIGRHTIARRNDIHHTGEDGIIFEFGGRVWFQGNTVHHIGWQEAAAGMIATKHPDHFQSLGSEHVYISENSFLSTHEPGFFLNSYGILRPQGDTIRTTEIWGNTFGGTGKCNYALYVRRGAHGLPRATVIRDNLIDLAACRFGPASIDAPSSVRWEQNRDATGAVIPLPQAA